jgi:hypothetical protein
MASVGSNDQLSEYRFRFATIAYPWPPCLAMRCRLYRAGAAISSSSDRRGGATSLDAAADGEIGSGPKPVEAKPLRYSRRQRVNKDRESPYRRAVTEPCRKPCRLSSTIRAFSSSDQSRRRPRSSADKSSMGETIVARDISHGLKAIQQIEADGLRRRGTIEVAAYNLHPKKMQEIQTPTDFREQVSVFKVDDFRSAARHE